MKCDCERIHAELEVSTSFQSHLAQQHPVEGPLQWLPSPELARGSYPRPEWRITNGSVPLAVYFERLIMDGFTYN